MTIFSLQGKFSLVSSNVQSNYKQDISSWVKNLALMSHSPKMTQSDTRLDPKNKVINVHPLSKQHSEMNTP